MASPWAYCPAITVMSAAAPSVPMGATFFQPGTTALSVPGSAEDCREIARLPTMNAALLVDAHPAQPGDRRRRSRRQPLLA